MIGSICTKPQNRSEHSMMETPAFGKTSQISRGGTSQNLDFMTIQAVQWKYLQITIVLFLKFDRYGFNFAKAVMDTAATVLLTVDRHMYVRPSSLWQDSRGF